MDLDTTFYVPSLHRNLVSLSRLDLEGYTFKFGHSTLSVFNNNNLISSGIYWMIYTS